MNVFWVYMPFKSGSCEPIGQFAVMKTVPLKTNSASIKLYLERRRILLGFLMSNKLSKSHSCMGKSQHPHRFNGEHLKMLSPTKLIIEFWFAFGITLFKSINSEQINPLAMKRLISIKRLLKAVQYFSLINLIKPTTVYILGHH